MIAVIAGGSGLTGSFLLKNLLTDPAISGVVAVGRKPLGAAHPKLTQVLVLDLAQLPTVAARLRGDLFFCCLGTTIKNAGSKDAFRKIDFDAVVAFGTIAREHRARSLVVVSAMGASKNSRIFYNRVKGEAEAALEALGLKRLVLFRPALLVGPRQEFRLGEVIATKVLGPVSALLPTLSKNVVTDVPQLATRMLEEGKRPTPAGNCVIVAVHI